MLSSISNESYNISEDNDSLYLLSSLYVLFLFLYFLISIQEPAKYEFSYEVKDEQSGADYGHTESRDGDRAQGEFNVLLPDGRKQIVEYEADQDGFKPQIRYEGEANSQGYGSGGPGGNGGDNGYPTGGPSNGYSSGRPNGGSDFSDGI